MRPVTPADILSFHSVYDSQITPDGELVAFVCSDPVKEFRRSAKSRIFVVHTQSGETRPYTSGIGSDSAPRWSPDGSQLAFFSERGGSKQVYLMQRNGGEAVRLTNVSGPIDELAWSPDGSRLAFLMIDPEPAEQRQKRDHGDDALLFEQNPRWRRVWTVDVASGETKQITFGDAQIWDFGWAPDGGFALVTGEAPYEWAWFRPALAYIGPDGGVPQTIYTVPEKCFTCPRVSPDGKSIAFLAGIWSDRGMNAGDVLVIPVGGGEPRVLTEGYRGNVWWMQWSPEGEILDVLAYEEGEAAIGRVNVRHGGVTTRWRESCAISESFDSRYIADNGTIALIRADATAPSDVWLATSDRTALSWKKLTHLHPHAAELTLGETRTIAWNAPDGERMQGLLILPFDYTPGTAVPLITWVHGGPAWLYTHTYQAMGRGLQIFAGAGFAVFMPNPRGSAGWGVPFLESNIGDFGGKDYEDIISGIDTLIANGIADPEKLGIGGWSYGGFMTAWALTQTNRFKAAMVGAAIINWRSFHGAAHIGLWDRVSLRANPYQPGNIFDTRSPITYVEQVQTPTLVVHGADDRIVPVDQGYEFFRALKDRGVPVEMVVYPREGHPINERLHQLDRLTRWVEWFKRYL